MPDTSYLEVDLGGHRIGRLERRSGGLRFTYTPEVLAAHPLNRPLLSCSLPVGTEPQAAGPYFEGLLPEGQHRAELAARADVAASDSFGLLARYGRDIAGAVSLHVPDSDRNRVPEARPLSAQDLEDEVAGLPERALGVHDDSELSLAGLQDKLLLVDLGGGEWARPVAGYPSTHILKLDDRRFPGLVAAESDAMALARAAGLTTVSTALATYAGIACLVVERFDRRRRSDGTVERVHQEDTCQALGVMPAHKYEVRHGGGGPELSQIAGLLDRYARDPTAQMDRLAQIAAFTAVIGNADAHGKNVALLHTGPGVIELAPLYDQVPMIWPKLQADAAMTIGGGVSLDTVTLERVGAEAKLWHHSPKRASEAATAAAECVLAATSDGTIDPDGTVAVFVRDRSERFLAR